jgi:glycosyltransferase involved in cell wall biosynthesis
MTTRVTLIVPCFNEAKRLTLGPWLAWVEADPGRSLLFVDDGSTDQTAAILRTIDHARVHVLALATNQGKGEAVRAGLLAASPNADLIGWWDADLATPLSEANALVHACTVQPDLWVAMGSRIAMLGSNIHRNAIRHYTGRIAATLASWALQLAVYDTQCGAKVLRPAPEVLRALADPWMSPWTFDVELLARLLEHGAEAHERLLEVPVRAWRDVPNSKVGWWDMLVAPIYLFRIGLRLRQRSHHRVKKTTSP